VVVQKIEDNMLCFIPMYAQFICYIIRIQLQTRLYFYCSRLSVLQEKVSFIYVIITRCSLKAKFDLLFSAHSSLKKVATELHFSMSFSKNIFHPILLSDTQKRRKPWQQDREIVTFRS